MTYTTMEVWDELNNKVDAEQPLLPTTSTHELITRISVAQKIAKQQDNPQGFLSEYSANVRPLALYRFFHIDFLSVDRFAEFLGISVEVAQELIDKGKLIERQLFG